MSEEKVWLSSGGLRLEGRVSVPAGVGPFPAVAVCHPHPLYGGDMHNNVVTAICQGLSRRSIATLRFNFRGVGGSQGRYGGGKDEEDDARAALDFMAANPRIDPRRTGLAGYSFGAGVAFRTARESDAAAALVLVSPVLQHDEWLSLASFPRPRLVVWGDRDEFASAAAGRMAPQLQGCHLAVAGADHFWSGYEPQLEQSVTGFFTAHLSQP